MAIFFSIGLGIGGVFAPFIFGILLDYNSRFYIAIGYFLGYNN